MTFTLNAQKREEQGSGASRRLRHAGKVPAIVYGAKSTPIIVEVDHNELMINLRKEAFHSSIIALNVDGQSENVLLRDLQMHAYKPLVLHVDFQRVADDQTIHQKVPLHFINGDIAPGVKLGGAKVAQIMNEVNVKCLPKDLPAFIEVDLKDMQAGQSLHISELSYPAGVVPSVQGQDPVVVSLFGKKGKAAATEGADAEA